MAYDDRAQQLDGVGVELRPPPRESRPEVEVARASGETLLVLPLPLLPPRLLLGIA